MPSDTGCVLITGAAGALGHAVAAHFAALADRHFRVEKTPGDPTHTRIEQLGDDERKAELERMLGGQEFLAAVRG